MIFTHSERLPHAALRPFVKAFWYLRIKSDIPLTPLDAMPIPEQCLYFYGKIKPRALFSDGSSTVASSATIFGQSTTPCRLFVPQDYLMFKIIFQAGGFFRLFGAPMTLFTDQPTDAETALGKELTEARDRIEQTEDLEQMIAIAENLLLQRLKRVKTVEAPLDEVIRQPGWERQSVDQLARLACLSPRQLERKFLERVGVSPKFYGRVARFNAAMKERMKNPEKSLMQVAFDHGYFDHTHLLRDFKQFTGAVPTRFDMGRALIY